ncbi:hypothetical protein DQ04_05871000 [Trypanosoma grayi]|uniref:hypothetical protein n=1 Tax=Trypanosoma grayi TaxID=71804 RepID=UPI0004F41AFC|nr:hypothetical protein DQ04_05871000 [Trypanosoma grayi]KEG09074.1 hypothetical protein DQ04_05871000 [Trypanosoma grayi]
MGASMVRKKPLLYHDVTTKNSRRGLQKQDNQRNNLKPAITAVKRPATDNVSRDKGNKSDGSPAVKYPTSPWTVQERWATPVISILGEGTSSQNLVTQDCDVSSLCPCRSSDNNKLANADITSLRDIARCVDLQPEESDGDYVTPPKENGSTSGNNISGAYDNVIILKKVPLGLFSSETARDTIGGINTSNSEGGEVENKNDREKDGEDDRVNVEAVNTVVANGSIDDKDGTALCDQSNTAISTLAKKSKGAGKKDRYYITTVKLNKIRALGIEPKSRVIERWLYQTEDPVLQRGIRRR